MRVKFVIVGAARTGSTLLVRTLNTLDGVRCHGELLGPEKVRGYEDGFNPVKATPSERQDRTARLLQERGADPVRFIDRALTSDYAATGFKALYSAFLHPQWRGVITFLQSVPDIRFIHLTRKNDLRRYISERILLEGGPNHSGAGGRSETPIRIRVDIDDFLRKSAQVETERVEIASRLAHQSVLDIHYEELAAATAATVSRVCGFLGITGAPAVIEPALQKVGAANLRDTVSNFQELLDHPGTRALALQD